MEDPLVLDRRVRHTPGVSGLSSFDSLRCFLAAAHALNFSRAARTVALTPTAFGQRIKQLEEHLGSTLFVRSTRSVTLTEAGLALVPAAKQCLAAVENCERVARGEGEHQPMDLTIGTRHELGMSWVLPNRTALMRARPWLHIHLYFSSGPDLILRVRTLEVDCAITSMPFSDPKLDAFQLHREEYAFVGSRKLLSRIPFRRADDAARHTLIDASPDLPLFRYFRDADVDNSRLRFARSSWLGNIAPIRQRVLASEGVAVLPEYFVRSDIEAGLLERVLPRKKLLYDHFRIIFRASDPRRSIFESLARDLARAPLR